MGGQREREGRREGRGSQEGRKDRVEERESGGGREGREGEGGRTLITSMQTLYTSLINHNSNAGSSLFRIWTLITTFW